MDSVPHLASVNGPVDQAESDPYPLAYPKASELESRRRWTRDDWIVYGLLTLEGGGLSSVRIEEMARRSGRTPGSFYGYFPNREALLDAMALDWQRRRSAQIEWTHRHLRRTGRYTLAGVIDDFRDRIKGEWVRPDLDLAMRIWARHDARTRRVVQSIDHLRLVNATAMVRAERPHADNAADLAVMLNWMLAGRHVLFIDPEDRELALAAVGALERWAQRETRDDSLASSKPATLRKRRPRTRSG